MKLDLDKHPYRITDGVKYAHFSEFALARETALFREWPTLQSKWVGKPAWTDVADWEAE